MDRSLSFVGYTIIPDNGRKLVYSSDIVHCYPGKNDSGTGDNKPTLREIQNCHDWLTKELQILKPKALLLLGKVAAETFFGLYRNEKINSFGLVLKKEFKMKVEDLNLSVFVLPHPASMYPKLAKFTKLQ